MAYLEKVGKAYARGAKRSCAVMVVGAIGGLALVATVLWVAGGRNASADSYRPLLAVALPMLFMLALGFGAALFVMLRNRRLDRAFAGLALEAHQVSGVTRGWHGRWGTRTLDAWFRKGPTLELYLGCEPATRGGLSHSGEFARRLAEALTSREPLDPSPSEAGGCTVYADDPGWMRRFLAADGVEESLARLLAETERVSPMFVITPNAVHYIRRFMPQAELNQQTVNAWLTDLDQLARAIEVIGPSTDRVQPTKLDEWARTRRGRRFLPPFFGCMALVIVLFQVFLLVLFYRAHY